MSGPTKEQTEMPMNKHRRGTLGKLWQYAKLLKKSIGAAMILTFVSNLLAMLAPILSGRAIDLIDTRTGAVPMKEVIRLALLMLGMHLVSTLLSLILSRLMVRIGQNITVRLRQDVFRHLGELPVGFFDRHPVGEMVSLLSYDIDNLNTSLSADILQILTSAITVLGSLFIMIRISPALVSVFALTMPLSVLIARYRARKIRPLFTRRSAKLAVLNGFSEEMIDGLDSIRVYHQEDGMLSRFDRYNTEASFAYYEADYQGSMTMPTVNFITNLSLSLISVVGSLLYMMGSLTLGNISSFVLYARKFSGPINEFANLIAELQSAMSAADRVFSLLETAPEPADDPDAVVLTDPKGLVEFRHVDFGYLPGHPTIRDFNLTAVPGSTIAIVGETGAGKTTLINLLMRFYDVDAGEILLDGVRIRKMTRNSLRQAFTMVLQDTWLFNGSIYENIVYGRDGVSRAQVETAAKEAKIHRYILSLPEGYDTILTDNGANISRGQKQLITIARAMLMDSKILILDEATSNVDTSTERQIQRAMMRLMEGKTSFVIAHRLSTIQHADLILVLEQGRVVEQGTHKTLLSRDGVYRRLYDAQFSAAAQ